MRCCLAVTGWLFAVTLPGQDLGRELAGQVVAENGEPLAGVAVCLIDSRAEPFVTADLVKTPLATTSSDGTYAATLPADLDGIDDWLLFVGRGRVHVSTPLHQHDGWPVVLPRAHTLVGRVVDSNGEPLANVRIVARDWLREARYREFTESLDWLPQPRTAVRSDARGRFVIPGTVAAGVRLTARGWPQTSSPVALGEPIELVLPARAARASDVEQPSEPTPTPRSKPAPHATVRAVDSDGLSIAMFRCAAVRGGHAVNQHAMWKSFARDSTNSQDGLAKPTVQSLGDGAITLLAVAPGMAAAMLPLAPDVDEGTIALTAEATLQGTVVDANGMPIAGAELWVCRGFDEAQMQSDWLAGTTIGWFDPDWGHVESDATGAFTVHHVAAGAQHLICHADGYTPPTPLRIEAETGTAISGLRITMTNAPVITGTSKLNRVPALGASIRLAAAGKRQLGGMAQLPETFADSPGARIAADGTFRLPSMPPGDYRAELVLPRPLQQGVPDIVYLDTVTITKDTRHLELDARAHLPVTVRGTVRGPVPAGRLLVGATVPMPNRGHYYDFAFYECALATVAPSGSFRVQTPPGECTLFVLDLWTGMMLHRDPPRGIATGDTPTVDFEIVAGSCDVQLNGLDPAEVAWLEMLVPAEWWPSNIDGMRITDHEYTKRIGCTLSPGATRARLYLPPMTVELWLVQGEQGDLEGRRGEGSCDVEAGKKTALTIDF